MKIKQRYFEHNFSMVSQFDLLRRISKSREHYSHQYVLPNSIAMLLNLIEEWKQ